MATEMTKAADIEGAPASNDAKTSSNKVTKWIALALASSVLVAAAIVVPVVVLKSTAPTSAVALTIDVNFPTQAGAVRTVDSVVDLGAQQWHLMTTSKGAQPVTPDEDDENCVHILRTGGKNYLFTTATCSHALTDVMHCSVHDASDPLPEAVAQSVEQLLAGSTSASASVRLASAVSAVQGDQDPFNPPAVCDVAEETPTTAASNQTARAASIGEMMVNDVRTTALLSITGEATRSGVTAELQQSDPEAWWWFAIPCRGENGRDYWVGNHEWQSRVRYQTATTNNGNNCAKETQWRYRTCYSSGIWSGWGDNGGWGGTYTHTECSCDSDHILEIVPNGNAVVVGSPDIFDKTACIQASTSSPVPFQFDNGVSYTKSTTLTASTSNTNTLSIQAGVSVNFQFASASLTLGASFANTVTQGTANTETQTVSGNTRCGVNIPAGGNTHFLKFWGDTQRYKQPVRMRYKTCSAHGQFGGEQWQDGEVIANALRSSATCDATMECAANGNPNDDCNVARYNEQKTSSNADVRAAATGCKAFAPGTSWYDADPPPQLEDNYPQWCPIWALYGMCTISDYQVWMAEHCPLTCSNYR